jgi:uncharacterized protein YecA (UPF0149 family)
MQVFPAEETRIREVIAKANRNDPCPCGSRKPIKQCHGKKSWKGY